MRKQFVWAMIALLLLLCACGDDSPRPTPTPVITVSLTPSTTQTLVQAQTMNFSVSMSNDSSQKGATWAVSGSSCTGAACGTLTNVTTTSATYNAPATVSANLTVSIVATSIADTTKSATVSVTVVPPPSITTASLPGGTQNAVYAPVTLAATGGITPYTWAISAGALPAGLTLNAATGVISGTPTAIGTADFTVRVSDHSTPAVTATKALSIVIAPATLAITTGSLPGATQNSTYTATLAAAGGTPPLTWSITQGALPAGLTLHASTGVIDGSPTGFGTASFSVTVTDAATTPQTATRGLAIAVNPVLTITSTNLPAGNANTAYTTTIQTLGGTAPLTWSVTQGALPGGLNLNPASGTISGTPTVLGTFNFTVQAADASTPTQTATAALSITINAAPLTIVTASLANGTIGTAYTATLSSAGGTPPITWTVTLGTLPSWTTLNPSTGAISGTPTGAPTTTSFTVTASDAGTPTQSATKALSITTVPAGVNNAELNGHYAFHLRGFLAGTTIPIATVGSFNADGSGLITGGVVDFSATTATQVNRAVTGGFYSVGADQRGTLTLHTTGGDLQFAFALGGITAGVATRGHMIGADTFVTTGVLKKQDPAAFSTAAVAGNFVFGLIGYDRGAGNARLAIVGRTVLDGAGAVTASNDSNDGGTVVSASFVGTYSVTDAVNGRGLFTDTTDSSSMAMYIISANEAFLIDINQAAGPPSISGSALKQTAATFSNASLNGAAVAYDTGFKALGPRADIILLTTDGAGNFTINQDSNQAGTVTTSTQSGTYTISSTGRVVIGDPTAPVLYLVAPNTGFMLGTGGSVEFGFFEPQTGGPFSTASLNGNYTFGDIDPSILRAVGSGVVTLNGGGGVTGTNDQNSNGVLSTTTIADTLSVAANGRVTLSNNVMWLISPNKALMIETGAGSSQPLVTVIEK